MTIKQLQFFVELAHSENFTKAADRLYITQPGLSYSIKQMENELSVPLFNRHGSGVTLTKFGEVFLPYAESVIKTLDDGLVKLKQLTNPLSGTLTLAFISTLSENLILDVLNTFYSFEKHEDITISLKPFRLSKSMFNFFESGEADIMLYYTPPEGSESFVVEQQELVLAVPLDHRLADLDKVTIEDIDREALCYPKKDSHLYKAICDMFRAENIEPNLQMPSEDWISMLTYTSLGKGLSIIPNVKSQIDTVKMLPIDSPFNTRSIYMCISQKNYSQANGAAKYFFNLFKEHLAK